MQLQLRDLLRARLRYHVHPGRVRDPSGTDSAAAPAQSRIGGDTVVCTARPDAAPRAEACAGEPDEERLHVHQQRWAAAGDDSHLPRPDVNVWCGVPSIGSVSGCDDVEYNSVCAAKGRAVAGAGKGGGPSRGVCAHSGAGVCRYQQYQWWHSSCHPRCAWHLLLCLWVLHAVPVRHAGGCTWPVWGVLGADRVPHCIACSTGAAGVCLE